MENQRKAARLRTLKSGKMVFNDGNSLVDCLVRDLSDTGAKLKVVTAIGVPDRFALLLEGETKGRPCTVVWRTATSIGVMFDTP